MQPKTTRQLVGAAEAGTYPVAETLDPDEKVYLLAELNRIDTTSRNVRRWEFIYVVRSDALAVHIRDMGPASLWPQSELQVISDWQASVAEVRADADDMRYRDALKKFQEDRRQDLDDMVSTWYKWRLELWEQKHNRSHFGPVYHRQRNEFVRKEA